jgi:hypothetical protein
MASTVPVETGYATLTRQLEQLHTLLPMLSEQAQQAQRTCDEAARALASAAQDEIFCHGTVVRTIIHSRELRAKLLPVDWFCDPAWDLLLRLYEAHADRRATTMGELIDLTRLKATTATRWVDVIAGKGWATRSRCPRDHRRVFVGLTDLGIDAMERYFESVRS